MFLESIIPEAHLDRTSAAISNINREYKILNTGVAGDYTRVPDGGALFGVGVRYSQHDSGVDFSQQQWGLSIDSDIAGDSPVACFIFLKAKNTLLWSPQGIQVMS